MKAIEIKITQNEVSRDLPIPKYMSEHASGMDLLAAVDETVILNPGEIKLIHTGIHLEIPSGYEAQVRPRSGLALKYGISIVNSPGTIDADYRGEVGAILVNHGDAPFLIERGDRIAQIVFQEVIRADLKKVSELGDTLRSVGGFGHTGV